MYLPSKNYEDLNDAKFKTNPQDRNYEGRFTRIGTLKDFKNRGQLRRILATCSTQRRLGCSARAKGLQRPEQISHCLFGMFGTLSGHETWEKTMMLPCR